ncbi:hypothetical protein [Nocardiopsis rhodophaea]
MDRYESELRRALRWYPRHYRERHGDEIVATALDLREPDESIPGRAELWGLMTAGLLTRIREFPPLWHWAGYRFLGKRVPYRYRAWVRDDLTGRRYHARNVVWRVLAPVIPFAVFMVPLAVWATMASGVDPWGHEYTLGFAPKIVETLAQCFLLMAITWWPLTLNNFGERRRVELLARHDFYPNGRPVRWQEQQEPGTIARCERS